MLNLVVSFMNTGRNISDLGFPNLFIHVTASHAAGKGIMDNTRNWRHHQNQIFQSIRVWSFLKVFPEFWQLKIIWYHISATWFEVVVQCVCCRNTNICLICLYTDVFVPVRLSSKERTIFAWRFGRSRNTWVTIAEARRHKFRSGWLQGSRSHSCWPFKTCGDFTTKSSSQEKKWHIFSLLRRRLRQDWKIRKWEWQQENPRTLC